MATIRKFRGKFNVQIRKKGYPFVSKSFVSLTVAKKWAATTEADMERRLHVVIPDDTTVGEFLKLCRRKEVHELHFHDLRHEATSRLFEKGLNTVAVATITGHQDPKVLMRYPH